MRASLSRPIGRLLIFAWIGIFAGAMAARAQSAQTLVQDTLHRADGSTAMGSVTVKWNSFTTAGGQAVAADQMTWKTDESGDIAIPLYPNAGSTPASYYRVIIKLNDELKTHMRWIVGNGNEGKIQELENRLQKHEAALQRTAGIGAALAAVLTILHLTMDTIRTVHH